MAFAVLGPLLLFLFLLASVIFLEARMPNSSMARAVREWQTGIAALVGLLAIGFSLSIGDQLKRQSEIERLKIEGKILAQALHAEVVGLITPLQRALSSAERGRIHHSAANEVYTDKPPELLTKKICKGGKGIIDIIDPVGVFRNNVKRLGLLPGSLAYDFVELHATWRRVNARIKKLPDVDYCSKEASQRLEIIGLEIKLILNRLVLINVAMKQQGFILKNRR